MSGNAGREAAVGTAERVRLMRDGLLNSIPSVVGAVIGLLLVPVLLRGLGFEAFGVWMAATAISTILAGFDVGITRSITREVAARPEHDRERLERFVHHAGNAQAFMGFGGAATVYALAFSGAQAIHIAPELRERLPLVFALLAATFLANWMLFFQNAILQGLRRFDLAAGIAVVGQVFRAGGMVVLIMAGYGLVPVVACEAAAALATTTFAMVCTARLEPRFRFRPGMFRFAEVRGLVSFALSSSLINAIGTSGWQLPQLVAGIARDATATALYNVGQRFPLAIAGLSDQIAFSVFPVASRLERAGEIDTLREILEVATRWVIVVSLPFVIVLEIVARELVIAWLGPSSLEAVPILRILAAAVFVDTVCHGAFQILWARGRALQLLSVLSIGAASSVVAGYAAMSLLGFAGPALVTLVAMTLASAAFVAMAAQDCGTTMAALLASSFRGLWLPATISALVAVAAMWLLSGLGWWCVAAVAMAGTAAYGVALYCRGARPEERLIARQAINTLRGEALG